MTTPYVIVLNSISGGGAENAMMGLATKLSENHDNVYVCALNHQEITAEIPAGLNVIKFERKWQDGIVPTISNFFQFEKVLREFRGATIIVNCELPELYVALSNWNRGKVIVVEHTSNPWFKRRYLGLLIRTILKLRKVIWVSVSSEEKKIWAGTKHPLYIANLVQANSRTNFANQIETDLLFVGRLREEKRPEWVIKAAIENDLTLHLFGDGVLREKLEFDYLGKSSLLKFEGFVNEPWSHIKSSALLVVPSEFEGDGLVVVEGILNGFQILLADNTDLRRFGLPDRHYFKNYEELNSKIQEWVQSGKSNLQTPEAIRVSLEEHRNSDLILDKWEKLFEIINKDKSKRVKP